ncbi:hypothetical protein DPEC_G00012460 [Dallia pectoralis]|uniref:Uncharacterized protein n=1 Tax=Dallia pectoralis TaxID=75939 RepID=A0ACC2HLS2_DALPE|nr:hypothetical protein DPEC_G00012460 [Dallia pectoralis]
MRAPSSRLLQKSWEAMEVQKAVILQTESIVSIHGALEVGKKELKEKEEQGKEYRKRFDNFLNDNDTNRCRALMKADQEMKLTNQKQVELLGLQAEMKALIKERNRLAKRVLKNAIYPDYLERVVQASEQFHEARQVMSRYDTLMLNREDLIRTSRQNQKSTAKARAHLVRFTEQNNDTLLHYNNTLARLQSKLDQARAESLIWESRWAHIQNTAAKKTLLLGTIKMASLNLYQCVWKRNKGNEDSPVLPEDTVKQLEKPILGERTYSSFLKYIRSLLI